MLDDLTLVEKAEKTMDEDKARAEDVFQREVAAMKAVAAKISDASAEPSRVRRPGLAVA